MMDFIAGPVLVYYSSKFIVRISLKTPSVVKVPWSAAGFWFSLLAGLLFIASYKGAENQREPQLAVIGLVVWAVVVFVFYRSTKACIAAHERSIQLGKVEVRDWTSTKDGTLFRGILQKVDGEWAYIKREDGRMVKIARQRLEPEDRQTVEAFLAIPP